MLSYALEQAEKIKKKVSSLYNYVRTRRLRSLLTIGSLPLGDMHASSTP